MKKHDIGSSSERGKKKVFFFTNDMIYYDYDCFGFHAVSEKFQPYNSGIFVMIRCKIRISGKKIF